MTRRKKIVLGILLVLVAIQFVRPARNESKQIQQGDFFRVYPAPQSVQMSVKTSCYDCHSNNTHYPWYANVQPVGWWLANHISEGKRELNLNEFSSYSHRRQLSKLKNMAGSVEDGSMPLSSYTLIHTNAKLTSEERKTLIDWLNVLKDSLATAWSNH